MHMSLESPNFYSADEVLSEIMKSEDLRKLKSEIYQQFLAKQKDTDAWACFYMLMDQIDSELVQLLFRQPIVVFRGFHDRDYGRTLESKIIGDGWDQPSDSPYGTAYEQVAQMLTEYGAYFYQVDEALREYLLMVGDYANLMRQGLSSIGETESDSEIVEEFDVELDEEMNVRLQMEIAIRQTCQYVLRWDDEYSEN